MWTFFFLQFMLCTGTMYHLLQTKSMYVCHSSTYCWCPVVVFLLMLSSLSFIFLTILILLTLLLLYLCFTVSKATNKRRYLPHPSWWCWFLSLKITWLQIVPRFFTWFEFVWRFVDRNWKRSKPKIQQQGSYCWDHISTWL